MNNPQQPPAEPQPPPAFGTGAPPEPVEAEPPRGIVWVLDRDEDGKKDTVVDDFEHFLGRTVRRMRGNPPVVVKSEPVVDMMK